MGDKINGEYFAPDAAAFNYNDVTGGADSASGGSGGSGMECLQLRSPPGPAFHYLISEQAKSLVALQELQNEVGALLEFRDLVIETFPNLRSKMAPSTPASDTRRDWEPGVRVRRKLAAGGGDGRAKPQPSVQDSGFSTETSCKEAHSASAPAAPRPRPLEDELWALLDVIQRKGIRLRDEAELLRGELDDRQSETAEDSFARALSTVGDRTDLVRLRSERDALLAHAARLEAEAEAGGAGCAAGSPARSPPLGRLDRALATPARTPRVNTPDSKKFTAILQESNPVELRRQLLISVVQNQSLREAAAARGAMLAARLRRARDARDDLAFRLEEKSIELEGALARVRQLEAQRGPCNERSADRGLEWGDERGAARGPEWADERGEARGLVWSDERGAERSSERGAERSSERGPERAREWSSERGAERGSMRDLRPLALPGDPAPRTRPSRIPRHKGAAPRPPTAPSRPPSSQSVRSARSAASGRGRQAPVAAGPGVQGGPAGGTRKDKCSVPVRRSPSHDSKTQWADGACASLVAEYLERTERLAALAPRLASLAPRLGPLHTHQGLPPPRPGPPPRTRPLPADLELEYRPSPTPQNLALELTKSILYEDADSIDMKIKSLDEDSLWNGKPQQYFESMNYGRADADGKDFEDDSLA